MRKHRKILIGISLAVLMLLSACGQGMIQNKNQTYPPKISAGAEEFFLFRPFSFSLGLYNLKTLQWKPIDAEDAQGAAFCFFGWGNVYPFFVFGQHGRLFHAGKIANSTLQFNFTLKKDQESLGPYATDGERFLYMIEQVTEDTYVKRIVTISEAGKIELEANLDGMPVMDGVIAGDYLYFTCPVIGTDFYKVWRIDLTKSDPDQEPVLVRDNYGSYKIYQYREKVLFLDNKKHTLYNDEVSISLNHEADLIMIDDEVSILAEMYPNEEMNLELMFTNISSGAILGTYKNAINFTREGSVITIYGNGFIEHLDLAEGD